MHLHRIFYYVFILAFCCFVSRYGTTVAFDLDAFNSYEEIRPNDQLDYPVYWLDALTHPNEWLTGATLLKILHHMLTNAQDPIVSDFLRDTAWHFLVVANPDGYVFTWTDDRNWTKSRNVIEGTPCRGTNLNRNFEYMWGNEDSSPDPCSNMYRGSAPGSEPETQVLEFEWDRMADRMQAIVSLHADGQMWLIPYGHRTGGMCTMPPDNADMMTVVNAAADATQNTWGTVWSRGNMCSVRYAASGTSIDYAKGYLGIKYTFMAALRKTGEPPEESIHPSFVETWNGIVAMVQSIENVELSKENDEES